MSAENDSENRQKAIIDVCLKKFVEKGLYETTSRDLTDALNMSPSALYYHFKNKDDAVIQCAEEAAIRVEEALLFPILDLIDDEEHLHEQSEEIFIEMQAALRFFAQVCTVNKYKEQMTPVLLRLREREAAYCEKFAQKIGCAKEELIPWFFAVITASQSYLIFGEEAYSASPLEFIKPAVRLFKEKYGCEEMAECAGKKMK